MESLPGLQLLSIIFAVTTQGHFWQQDQGAVIRSIKWSSLMFVFQYNV